MTRLNILGIFLAFSLLAHNAAAYYTSDVQISLSHDNGSDVVSIVLFEGAKDITDGSLVTLFDDEAVNAHSGSAPFASTMQGFEALSAFDGRTLDGLWTLSILDTFFPDEGDVLDSWGLSGLLDGGVVFSSIVGIGGIAVDTNPATEISLLVSGHSGALIADLNVDVAFAPGVAGEGEGFPGEPGPAFPTPPVPVPPSAVALPSPLAMLAFGLLALVRRRAH